MFLGLISLQGRIINVTCVSGMNEHNGHSVTIGGVIDFTNSVAAEHRGRIQVNVISSGLITTASAGDWMLETVTFGEHISFLCFPIYSMYYIYISLLSLICNM